jgi:alkaline phosphatase D
MLDTRLEGREPQPLLASDTTEYRTILGEEQLNWLAARVNNSDAKWKIIGNQVILSPFNVGFAALDPTNLSEITLLESIFVDIWDGYPKERRRLLNRLRNNPQIDNVVVLTGDFHCSFAFDVTDKPVDYPNPLAANLPTPSSRYNPATGDGSLAVEFATPSITSANFDENTSLDESLLLQAAINADIPVGPPFGTVNYNPHMKYVELINHGYMILDLTEGAAQADWYYVNILQPNDDTQNYGGGQLTVDGSKKLTAAPGEAAEKTDQPDLAPFAPNTSGIEEFTAPDAEKNLVALSVFPIPVKAGHPIFLHFALNHESDFTVELMDVSGRVISSVNESGKSAGTYTFTLPTAEDIPAGVYILNMRSANETITRKIVIE